ncbi:MAG: hypothetical protein COA79_13775 [Planctomycetota bacterium]|nr:MAG: hypothetical protein COA79_13775 [Planctomycetota bacterium]
MDVISQVLNHVPLGFSQENREVALCLLEGEVLVEIDLATICGSDLHSVHGKRETPLPGVLGHEAVGRIVQLEKKERNLKIGDRVTWTLVDNCGNCQPCLDWNHPEKCENLFKYGHAVFTSTNGLNGCFASHIHLRRGTHLVKIPDTLNDFLAAPVNCSLATMVNVVETMPQDCKRVLILGAGILGIYGCALLHQKGIKEIYCLDISSRRLSMVPSFGGIPLQEGLGAYRDFSSFQNEMKGKLDMVIEVAGVKQLVAPSLPLIRPGGLLTLAGLVHPDSELGIKGEDIIRKCLTIRGVHNYQPKHLDIAVDFLNKTRLEYPYEKLVSKPYPLDQIKSAFSAAEQGEWHRVSLKPNLIPEK